MQNRIFITGGASGLGREIALRWARQGAHVCIADVNDARGAEVLAEIAAQGGTGHFLRCDVTRLEDLEAAARWMKAQWGGADVVVNNAGVATCGALDEEPVDQWQWVLDINLLGVVRGCKAFAPLLRAQGSGHIVNIASMAGLVHLPRMGSYNAAKAGVVAFSETLHYEMVAHGVGVSVVCPAFFKTNLGESMRSTNPNAGVLLDKLFEKSPITAAQIAAQVEDAVRAKRFLVLPHRDDRIAYRIKSFLPVRGYLKFIYRFAQRIERMGRAKS